MRRYDGGEGPVCVSAREMSKVLIDPEWLARQACSRRRMDRTREACGECDECIGFREEAEPVIPEQMFVRHKRAAEPSDPPRNRPRLLPQPRPPRRYSNLVLEPRLPAWCGDEKLKSRACVRDRVEIAACGTCAGCKAYDAGPPDLPESAFPTRRG